MVEAMDQAVGKVLETLKTQGVEESTIVFFVSDNGGLSTSEGHPTSNSPLRAGKGWLYEGGIRAPMIIKWPGVTSPGRVCDVPVITNDFHLTILEMAGASPRDDMHRDGVSLARLLDGDAGLDRNALFWHYPHYGNQGGSPSSAIRSGDWKLIEWYETGRIELFDLSKDIGEHVNLARENGDTAERLRKDLHAWLKATGARMPTPNLNRQPTAQPKK
jgi:arylsulfatase A-like enzyme